MIAQRRMPVNPFLENFFKKVDFHSIQPATEEDVSSDYLLCRTDNPNPINNSAKQQLAQSNIRYAAYQAMEDETEEFAQDILNYINFIPLVGKTKNILNFLMKSEIKLRNVKIVL